MHTTWCDQLNRECKYMILLSYFSKFGAGDGNRTRDRLITNRPQPVFYTIYRLVSAGYPYLSDTWELRNCNKLPAF
jgi:hypothetical protein